MNCKVCGKKVPKRYWAAHKKFHLVKGLVNLVKKIRADRITIKVAPV